MPDYKPEVSVWMITYNHEKYVRQALDSILSQKTNFRFEIIIGDDCSTDQTPQILKEYQNKYPEIVKPILRNKNIGIWLNLVDTWQKCSGKYIALLEGDDYWTVDDKLQEQYDFLEKHTEYVLCYHNTKEVNDATGAVKLCNTHDPAVTKLEDLLRRGWFIRTGSIFLRNIIDGFPDWYFRFQSTDYMLQILMAEKGNFAYINRVTSVYRRHGGGITNDFHQNQIDFNNKKILLLKTINEYFNNRYKSSIDSQIKEHYLSSLTIKSLKLSSLSDYREWLFYFYQTDHLLLFEKLYKYLLKRFK